MTSRFVRVCVLLMLVVSGAASAAEPKNSDPLGTHRKASSWIASKEGPIFVEFLSDGTMAALRGRTPKEPAPVIILLDPGDAIRLLTDKRMAFLWQPLKEWGGPTLAPARDRLLGQLREAAVKGRTVQPSGSTSQSSVREPVRAVLQLASFLSLTGRGAEAEAILRQQQQTMPFKAKEGWRGIEWMSVGLAIANAQKAQNNIEGAIEQYRLLEHRMAAGPFAINATVNRAATLAEFGRYSEALSTIEAAWAQYARQTQGRDGDQIPGSERQFAWIKACALHGLGRQDEARALLGTLVEDRRLEDEQFVLEPDDSLRFRAAMCMKDFATIKWMLMRGIKESPAGATALVWLQPAFVPQGPWKQMVEMVRADAELGAAARERMQILPDELSQALNGWRTPGISAAAANPQ